MTRNSDRVPNSDSASFDVFAFEKNAAIKGYRNIAGLDEAGRGPLAGPVVAAAVILPSLIIIPGVDDSKRLSARRRCQLFSIIRSHARSVGIGLAHSDEIDSINILEATRLAMLRAIRKMTIPPDYLLLDALTLPSLDLPQDAIIKGDQKSHSISAASIVAKVVRDRIMLIWDKRFPQYGWRKNKGYGTSDHLDAIRRFGPCSLHRRSFRGVMNYKGLFGENQDVAQGL